jgi:hypothetical protein
MYAKGPRELQTSGVEAESFEALADIAVASLRGERNLVTVCGPISTGGTGNQMHNFEVFNAVIRGLERCGKKLFNQIPYEFGLRKLAYAWEAEGNTGYCMPILTVFYARIFESGAIGESYFIPGWRSSFGARWEREKLARAGCAVHDLTHAEIRLFLRAEYPPEHVGAVMALIPE